jgi:predicted permease
MGSLVQDVRYALRLLRKSPGFTAVAVLVLALGIGANATMFSLVNAFLFRPLIGSDDGVLYGLYSRDRTKADDWRAFSYPNYRDIRDGNDVFNTLLAHSLTMVGVREDGATRRTMAGLVSANYFKAMGVRVAEGRAFLPEEEEAGSDVPVAIVSHGYWQRTGADPHLLGKTVNVNGRELTIVGITPAGFTGTTALLSPEVWLPLGLYETTMMDLEKQGSGRLADRANHTLVLVGRLKPGLTAKLAEERLATLARGLEEAYPGENKNQTLTLHPVARMSVSTQPGDDAELRAPAVLLLAMAGVVLLIACLNLANMLLARGEGRRKEIAIRLAVGSGRGRILRQLLTEALVLSALGGAAGLLLAGWATTALMSTIGPYLPIELVFDSHPDWRVLAVTFSLCVLSAVLAALGPGLRLTRQDTVHDLKEQAGEARGAAGRRLLSPRNLMVTAQVALSLVLVTAAGLFMRGAARAAEADPGFRLDGEVVVELDPSLAGRTEAQARETYRALVERVRALPDVEAASLASIVPFGMFTVARSVAPVGTSFEGGGAVSAIYTAAGADYFRALGLGVKRGRDFTASEEEARTDAHVVLINEPLANRLWPSTSALGQTLQIRSESGVEALEVVGIVPGLRHDLFDAAPVPQVYVPVGSHYQANLNLHVRAVGGSRAAEAGLLQTLRKEVRAVDPMLPVVELRTLRAHRDASILLWAVRTASRVFTVFGLLALFLAVVGVYGVKSYLVAQRTREFGIRMALGAAPRDVRRLVLGEGVRLLAVGLAIGLALSALAAKALSGMLYEVSAIDPATFTLAPLLLALATFVACELPARRATRVAPITALRHE